MYKLADANYKRYSKLKMYYLAKYKRRLLLFFLGIILPVSATIVINVPPAFATCPPGQTQGPGTECIATTTDSAPRYACGSNSNSNTAKGLVYTSFDFGCKGDACVAGNAQSGTNPGYCGTYHNPIVDAAFSIIQFLSAGVGVIVVASLVVAGIQYSASRDDPNANAAAKARIRTTIIALVVFIFSSAILDFVAPGIFN